MKFVTYLSLIIFCGTLSTSCASLFGDNNRTVHIKSNVEDALVKVNGNSRGVAPTTMTVSGMDTFSSHTVTIEKEGYYPASQEIKKSFQPVFLLNVFTGFLGILIDVFTGNINKVETKEVHLQLKKKEK